MRLSRNQRYLFWLGMGTAVMAVAMGLLMVYLYAQREAIQQSLRQRVDSVPALAFQSEREFLRLRQLLELSLQAGTPPDRDALQLRYDIFLSRLALLRDNPSVSMLEEREEYKKVVPRLDALVQFADPLLNQEQLTQADLRTLLQRFEGLGQDMQALSMAANSIQTRESEQQARDLAAQSDLILGLALGQFVLLLVSSVALVLRHRRQEAERLAIERLNAELSAARHKADAASRAKSLFLAHMSHELRTPFSGVLGMLDLLHDTPLTETQSDYLRTAQTSARHLHLLLSDILDVTALDEGRLSLRYEACSLQTLVDEVFRSAKPLARAKGLSLVLQSAQVHLPVVLADGARLRQILENLLQNAIKFTQYGEVRLMVKAAPADKGLLQCSFAVCDTGIGMDEAGMERLFQHFSQVRDLNSRMAGGTGLGLYISQALAQLMGGAITVQSTPGKGSVFTLALPLETPMPEPARAADISALPGSQTPAAPVQVLLVEDNLINQKLALLLLKKLGCEVACSENGRLALDRLQGVAFDLILMDVNMPVLDGLAATREIRALAGPVGQTPVVVVTADVMNEAIENAFAAGANDFIAKPLQLEKLAQLLQRFVPRFVRPLVP
jgi:two-component system, sensor histidine kinase